MLKFHHLGCLVDSIEEAAENYKGLFAMQSISEKILIASQQVYVCFVQIGEGQFIELVEPVGEDSVVSRLKRKGETYYHAGYLGHDFDKALEQLEEKSFKLLSVFYSEAFNMRRCAFLYSTDIHLIELIEEE